MNLIPVYGSHLAAKAAMDAPLDQLELIEQPAYINVRFVIMMICSEKYREYKITTMDHIVYYTTKEIWWKLHDIATEWI